MSTVTLAKTLESSYFGGKIFGKTFKEGDVPPNECALEKIGSELFSKEIPFRYLNSFH